MAANYRVHLTATAGDDYQRLYEHAEIETANGGNSGDGISQLKLVDEAIDNTLAFSPINQRLTMGGKLSFVYLLCLDLVCIYYLAYPEQGMVYVLHIGPSQKGADLSTLKDAVIKGETAAEDLLAELGIEKRILLDDRRPEAWLN